MVLKLTDSLKLTAYSYFFTTEKYRGALCATPSSDLNCRCGFSRKKSFKFKAVSFQLKQAPHAWF
ncbi:hypothetical protein B5D82_03775 [Cognaticolwellia beringensis]|uniref:Uncharacterized protein n=1 Tax=Cognaticolwellia beringensis TaxID=1967665 RepID=A0A222G586_9GAMM|nr:hypothetical protein B5D82_03775 [Cognaticolwellia beringensis]